MFDKLKGAFGFDDINFESAEFSGRFHVSAPSRKWAYDILHARAIDYLLNQSKRYTIAMDHGHVFLSTGNKRWEPREFMDAVHVLDGLLDMMPDYLRRQQQERVS